jgi:hypothetical protein
MARRQTQGATSGKQISRIDRDLDRRIRPKQYV